jgi:arginase
MEFSPSRIRFGRPLLIRDGDNQVTESVAKRVYAHASKGQLTVTLGGDHSLVRFQISLFRSTWISTKHIRWYHAQAMGTVSGTFKAYPEACLIWVDAHAVS